jgi:hypothetical protein
MSASRNATDRFGSLRLCRVKRCDIRDALSPRSQGTIVIRVVLARKDGKQRPTEMFVGGCFATAANGKAITKAN